MTVPPKYRGRLCGLCGDFNGDKNDDFFGKTPVTRFIDGQHFGDSWRVGGLRACSVLPKDMPHSYEPECKQTWSSRIKSDQYCNALKSSLFAKCANIVDHEYYYKACKLDMCECPGEQCHCEVLTAYARECERAGQLIYDWRQSTGCKNVTSFKYSEKHQNEVILPEKKPIQTTIVPMTTSTVTTVATTISTIAVTADSVTPSTALPDWILGPYLPGCSHETAEFCKNAGKKNSKRVNHQKRMRNQLEKRRRRRKEKARKKKSRRARKRKRRQRLRQQRRRKQKQRKQQKQQTFKMGDIALTMRSEKAARKFEWSSILGGKRPPFEALLSPENGAQNSEDRGKSASQGQEFEDLAPSSYFDEISSSDYQKRPKVHKNGRQRKPLPLKEAFEATLVAEEEGDNQRTWKRRKRK